MPVFRFATVQGQNIVWFLQRNCSVTPTQLGWFYASLCVVSLAIAAFFWLHGATLILPSPGWSWARSGWPSWCTRAMRPTASASAAGPQAGGRAGKRRPAAARGIRPDWVRVEPRTGGAR
jgi:hypothetical protein